MVTDTEARPEQIVPYQRQSYRHKVRQCLEALGRMLTRESFSFGDKQIGLELELNLVDESLRPAMANTEVLEKLDNPSFTTELSQHNLELNIPPRSLTGDSALELETELRETLNYARGKAADTGNELALIGILPTLDAAHFQRKWISNNPRYVALNDQICASRGEQLVIDLDGAPLAGGPAERVHTNPESILPEAACTSAQLHLQVSPDDFASHWNVAQCLAGVQLALAANSPFLLGKALWHETRIPLFLQATDTRPEELKNQGVRPRVWFGERWISSIFDLFEENVRYFPGLIAETDPEDPLEALASGRAPNLAELRLHNGTIWRWNRPVYDLVRGVPHVRIENRVLPAGPTVSDVVANAAFFYGTQLALVRQQRPLWERMSFRAAEDNMYAGARYGMHSRLYWPECGWVRPDELVLGTLLPLAHEGLRAYGVSDAAREHYLGIIEQRCRTRQNGSTWQRATVAAFERRGLDRTEALRAMLGHYLELMHANHPVHSWPIPVSR